jgi:Tol biopolymer transport system component
MARKPVALTILLGIVALAAAAPAQGAFPGRNGLLVYGHTAADGSGAIGTMRADGTHRHRLVSRPGATQPVWSPDGRRIGFAARTGEGQNSFEIYVMRADGSHLRRITHNSESDTSPSWGPTGGAIAFVRASYDEQGNQIPNSAQLRIVAPRDGAAREVVEAPMHEAAWSPDGTMIAFADGTDLYVLPPNGGTPRHIAQMEPDALLVDLDWLNESAIAQGGTVSFTDFIGGPCDEGCTHGAWEVGHAIDAYAHPDWVREPERVTPWAGGSARHVVWSPNGRRAVFCAAGPGFPSLWDLHTMSWDGTGARTLRQAPCANDWQALPPKDRG